MANTQKHYPLRLDLQVYKLIEEQAKAEDRSVNYVINKLLEKQLKEEKQGGV